MSPIKHELGLPVCLSPTLGAEDFQQIWSSRTVHHREDPPWAKSPTMREQSGPILVIGGKKYVDLLRESG